MQIPEGLPKAECKSEQEAPRIKSGSDVIAKKLRIAEDISGAGIVIGIP
jgi:hypothetical protein